MNPRDYYHLKTASITEADVKKVAEVMADHIGKENRIKKSELCGRVSMDERKVRDILAIIAVDYRWGICSSSGVSGYWVAANEDERWQGLNDLRSRNREIDKRYGALLTAKIPNALELNRTEARVMQTGLFGG
jgi:hypothetical protein